MRKAKKENKAMTVQAIKSFMIDIESLNKSGREMGIDCVYSFKDIVPLADGSYVAIRKIIRHGSEDGFHACRYYFDTKTNIFHFDLDISLTYDFEHQIESFIKAINKMYTL